MNALPSDSRSDMPDALRQALDREGPDAQRELAGIWHALGASDPLAAREAPASDPALDEAWDRLDAALDAAPASGKERLRASDRPPADRPAAPARRRRWAAALAVAVVLVAGVTVALQPVVEEVPATAQHTVLLPDGSEALLNSGTRLTYPSRLQRWWSPSEARHLRLEGEAFFDVVTSATPFVVETAEARVEVLGTRFNVRARDGQTDVALEEGRVAVSARQRPAQVQELSPGEVVAVQDAAQPPAAPHAGGLAHAFAWREGGFAASRMPLAALVAELERRYGVPVALQGRPTAADTLSLYYPAPTDLETLLTDVGAATGLSVRPTSRGFALTER